MTKVSAITAGALLAICVMLVAAPAWAFGIDPPVWAVTGTGTANQFSGQNFLFAGEVNKLGAGSDIGLYIQGGSPSNNDFVPMYLILGIPNATASFTLPTITGEKVYFDAGTPNGSGIINAGAPNQTFTDTITPATSIAKVPGPGSTTVPLVWTGPNNQDVYDKLGLSGGPGSELFTNWVQYDAHLTPPITATQFLVAVYDVSKYTDTTSFTGEGLIDVTFSAGLPVGTFVVGYGCQGGSCDANGPNPFATPFTQAGIITEGRTPPTQVPQPATLMVLGVSLISFVVGSAFKRRIS